MNSSVLQMGGARACNSQDAKDLVKQIKDLIAVDPQSTDDALLDKLEKLGTFSISLQNVKPPGFLQKIDTLCVLSGKDALNTFCQMVPPYPPDPPVGSTSYSTGLSPGACAGSTPKISKLLDNISLLKGQVKPDWVRIGLLGAVLFMFLVILALLATRHSSSATYPAPMPYPMGY